MAYVPPTRAEIPDLLSKWGPLLERFEIALAGGGVIQSDEHRRGIIALLLESEVRREIERRSRTPLQAFTEGVFAEEIPAEDRLPDDIRQMVREMLSL